MGEWKKAEGMECTDSDDGYINDKGDPENFPSTYATFLSTDTTPPLVGTGPGQYDRLKVAYGEGRVRVGLCAAGGGRVSKGGLAAGTAPNRIGADRNGAPVEEIDVDELYNVYDPVGL